MPKRLYDTDELEVVGYSVLSLSTTGAVTLSSTASTVNANSTAFTTKVKRAYITIEAPCRFRLDGTAPTTSNGNKLNAGDILDMTQRSWGATLNSTSLLQFIATTSTTAGAAGRVTYFR